MKKQAIVFDIDGVLAEKSPERDYREYDKVDLDKPISQGFDLCEMYVLDGYEVLFVTGRKELCREKTVNFLFESLTESNSKFRRLVLNKESLNAKCVEILKRSISNSLFMRDDGDHRKAQVLKKEIYDYHIKDKYDVVAAFDDDPLVCNMYKNEGLFVFQVVRG
jgi:hypothetical protein